jgi:PAS domain S-box-containing protein
MQNYHILEILHESTRFKVLRATRKTDNKPVILKVGRQAMLTPKAKKKLDDELQLAQQIQSTHVAHYIGLEEYEPNYWLFVQEDMGGTSLAQLIPSQGFDIDLFLPLALQIATGLQAIHQQTIIHKDIKPSNIIWNGNTQQLAIIDFGSAVQAQQINHRILPLTSGTLAYIAPEQTGRINRAIDYRTDFYALGVTFYQLITGRLPFQNGDALQLMHQHIAQAAIEPHTVKDSIPPFLSALILKLMAKNPEERYQSSHGLLQDLQICITAWEQGETLSIALLGQHDVTEKLLLPQTLYGRDAELTVLTEALERISQGQPEMVMVAGPAGVGKTMLINELQQPLTLKRGYLASGKFDQLQKGTAYSALGQAFGGLIRQLLAENESQFKYWQQQVQTAVGNNGQLLMDIMPELQLLIGEQPAVPLLGATETKNRLNYVFTQFITTLAQAEHPLVLFLDDVQWADNATLDLLKTLMTESDIQHLLVIGAYRDNEVDELHPAMSALAELRQANRAVQTVTLKPLALPTITQWLADTLHLETIAVEPLADRVYQKTEGNPFFIKVFLQTLYEEKLLTLSNQAGWQWDINAIHQRPATENVVIFMASRLQQLLEDAQKVLAQMSCVGNECDIEFLAQLSSQTASALLQILQPAFKMGLVDERDERLCFAHDRIQEAAYALLSDTDKIHIHFAIAEQLEQDYVNQPDKLFDMVEHFNKSQDLIIDKEMRYRVAQFNLTAAIWAKNAAAYQSALTYLNASFVYVKNVNLWTDAYTFAFALYKETAEVEYLNGNLDVSYDYIEMMLTHVSHPVERADINTLLVIQKTLQADYPTAINLGCDSLKELGIELPTTDFKIAIRQALEEVQERLKSYSSEDLLSLPVMTEPEKIAAIKLLFHLIAPTYLTNPELYFMIGIKMVSLALDYGNTPETCAGYATYGLLQCTLENYQLGYDFGDLGFKLSEKFDSAQNKARVTTTFALLVYHWARPVLSAKKLSEQGYQAGIESGELQAVGYIHFGKVFQRFYQGDYLADIAKEANKCLLFVERTKNQIAVDTINAARLALKALIACSDETSNISDTSMNDSHFETTCLEHNSFYSLTMYYIYKAQVLYLLGYYSIAFENIVAAQKNINYISGMINNITYNQYYSLILLQIYSEQDTETQQITLLQVNKNQGQMLKWSESCPENFLHHYTLIEAELARIQQQPWQALKLYNKAIQLAHQHHFMQDEALANELAARFFIAEQQPEMAERYLQQAYLLYQQWGAQTKVQQLIKTYPHLQQSLVKVSKHSSSNDETIALNIQQAELEKILQASQAISREVTLSQFLQTVMQIMTEISGAQIGTFFTVDKDTLTVRAQSQQQQIEIQSIELVDWQQGAISIVQYVQRTQQVLILDKATQASQFKSDSYIQQHQVQSVLVMPIQLQGTLKVLLYLENNLIAQAFTPHHVELLTLLGQQIAITLENVTLYEAKKQDEQRYRTLTEATQAIIWSANTQGHFVKPQYSWRQFTGQHASQYIKLGWLTALHEDDRERIKTGFIQQMERAQPFHELVRIRVKDGYYKYIIFNAVPLFNDKHELIEWMGTGLDIHALKQTEEQLRLASNNLNLALDAANIGTWSWDLISNKVDIDANIFTLYDISPKSYQYQLSEIFATLHPDDREAVDKALQHSIEQQIPYEIEYRIVKKDKSVRHVAARGRVIYQDNTPQRITGTAWDITLEKERRLLQAAEVYRQKLEEYIDTICHEIRNPLNGIYGGIYALENTIQALEQLLGQKNNNLSWEIGSILAEQLKALKDTYDNLKTCSEQQKVIVDDVLDLSKMERNKLELQLSVFDPKQAVLTVVRMFSQILTQKQLTLKLRLPDEACCILSDEGRFNQVLINLLSNASKFTAYGSITVSLDYYVQENNNVQLEVHVQDTGAGMNSAQIERLFQPFTQVHKGNQLGGTGLGLTISKKLTSLMGGTLMVTSEEGRGSDFSFTIRATRAKAPKSTEQHRLSSSPKSEPARYHILIVEDNLINQKVLTRLLDKDNHTYTIANNGLEGWQYFQEARFNMILMDIEMPVMNGLEATQKIRTDEQQAHKPRTPIIGLSGNARTEQIEQARAAGMDEYMTKPFHHQTLKDLMQKVMKVMSVPLSSPTSPSNTDFFSRSKSPGAHDYVITLQQEAKALLAQAYPFEVQREDKRLVITLSNPLMDNFMCNMLLKKLKKHLHSVFKSLTKMTLTNTELQLDFKHAKDIQLVSRVLETLGFTQQQAMLTSLLVNQM